MSKRKNVDPNREFWESAEANRLGYVAYYRRIVELTISMFEWKNLPEGCDPRFLELTLFSRGNAVFFQDKDLQEGENVGTSYLALPCAISGKLNLYNIPTQRRAYATNGYQRNLTEKDSVVIYNNMVHSDSKLDVEIYARRLWDIDRAIDINIKAQKTPLLIKASERERQTLLNLYKQYVGNEPVIFGTDGLNPDALTVLQTNAPFVADKLHEAKTQIWNELLTYLGISNVNLVKKERMIMDEVNRNLGSTMASRYSRLNSRKQACEEINKMFGLNIDVEFREDMARRVDDIENGDEEFEGREEGSKDE